MAPEAMRRYRGLLSCRENATIQLTSYGRKCRIGGALGMPGRISIARWNASSKPSDLTVHLPTISIDSKVSSLLVKVWNVGEAWVMLDCSERYWFNFEYILGYFMSYIYLARLLNPLKNKLAENSLWETSFWQTFTLSVLPALMLLVTQWLTLHRTDMSSM